MFVNIVISISLNEEMLFFKREGKGCKGTEGMQGKGREVSYPHGSTKAGEDPAGGGHGDGKVAVLGEAA